VARTETRSGARRERHAWSWCSTGSSATPALEVAATVRSPSCSAPRRPVRRTSVSSLDANVPNRAPRRDPRADWIVNAIGITKPYVRDDVPLEVERAVRVNAIFPHELAAAAPPRRARVLQIATDCVFSGREGGYAEGAAHEPARRLRERPRAWAKSEPRTSTTFAARSLDPSPRRGRSYSSGSDANRTAHCPGFTDHGWNGITTFTCTPLPRDREWRL